MTTANACPRNIEDILARLTNVKKAGDGWTAACPAPGHETPGGHLSLKDVGRLALVSCHPGPHTYGDVCVGLGFSSLAYSANGKQPEDKTFPKLSDDEAMDLLKQSYCLTDDTIRHFAIKPDLECWGYPVMNGFRYKKYSRQGPRKYWHVTGTRNQLYGLADIPEGTTEAYLVNGEPSAWICWQAGIPAVCGIYGEGRLPEDSVSQLKSKGVETVIIIPDLDRPGKTAALKEYGSLKRDFQVHIRQLPDFLGEKADVCDLFTWCGGDNAAFKKALADLPDIDLASLEFVSKDTSLAPGNRPGEVRLINMADVQPEAVSWLWYPYIPKGKITMIEGDPGIGKSWVSLAIATAISLGRGLPGVDAVVPGRVLLCSAEDGVSDTLRPRLDAMGADVSKVYAIEGALDFGNGGLEVLRQHIEAVRPALVCADPLVAYIGAGVDIHRANETRAVMAALADIAASCQAAFLLVRHLTKGGTSKPIYRGLGSIDFTAACRSVLLAGCDPDDPAKRGLVHIKSNLAAMGPPVGYELKDGCFYWRPDCDLTAAKILAAEEGDDNKSARDEATEFLEAELSAGPVDAAQIFRDAKELDLATATLKRAKSALGIITRRLGEPGKQGGGKWTWQLPAKDTPGGHLEDQKDLGYQDVYTEKLIPLIEDRYKSSTKGSTDDPLNPLGGQPEGAEAAAWKF